MPPFRAEHVGSLLRPQALRDARAAFARHDIDQHALTAAEDRAIAQAIALQERVGLRLATDGEFRRASYHSYFYRQLGDISFDAPAADASGGRGAQPMAAIRSRIAWNGPIHAADHAFLRGRTTALPKITFRELFVVLSITTSAAACSVMAPSVRLPATGLEAPGLNPGIFAAKVAGPVRVTEENRRL